MRTHVAIIALFTTGWAAAPAGVHAETRAQRVGLRVCEALDRQAIAEILDGYLPEVRFVPQNAETEGTPWLAELCFDGETVVSTLTDTDTGASHLTWPVPSTPPTGQDRFAAHVLGDQVRGMIEAPAGSCVRRPRRRAGRSVRIDAAEPPMQRPHLAIG